MAFMNNNIRRWTGDSITKYPQSWHKNARYKGEIVVKQVNHISYILGAIFYLLILLNNSSAEKALNLLMSVYLEVND